MLILLLLPICIISLSIYLLLTVFGNSLMIWISALILGAVFCIFVLKKDFSESINELKLTLFTKTQLPLVILLLMFVFVKAYVISPLVITLNDGNFTHIQIAGVGDYYKHSYVVNIYSKEGVTPHNPYFPQAPFSYYYGYYLIPAAITKIFGVMPHVSFYFFVIFTDIIALFAILRIFYEKLDKFVLRLSAVLLFLFASGVDVLPHIFTEYPPLSNMINQQMFAGSDRFQLINNYTTFIYVPQHFFAAALAVVIVYLLLTQKYKFIFLVSATAFTILCSIFVSMTLSFWIFLIFIFKKEIRLFLVKLGLAAAILSTPFLITLSSSGRQSIFYFYSQVPYQIISGSSNFDYWLNTFLTFLIKYGPILCLLPVLIVVIGWKFIRKNLIFVLGIFLPLMTTWFVRTPRYDDFSMRTSIPIQFGLPLIFLLLVKPIKNKLGISIVTLTIISTVIIGMFGFYVEYSRHWKNRYILNPKDSELLLTVRNLPEDISLASLDRDRWVELIPSLAQHQIQNPFLYDSFDYITSKYNREREIFQTEATELFVEENIDKSLDSLISKKKSQFNNLYSFFRRFPKDQLILPNQLWFKKDINPWLAVIQNMNVKTTPLTSQFTIVDYSDLLNKLNENTISPDTENAVTIQVENRMFPLKKGLWYLASCLEPNEKKAKLHLELEDYSLVFNRTLDGVSQKCVGKMFYLQEDEKLLLTTTSKVEQIWAFPLKIIKK